MRFAGHYRTWQARRRRPLAQITRQAQQGRILQIKLLSDPEAARILLAAHPGVGQIRHMDSVLDLDFVGEDADVAALLAVLVEAGIKLSPSTKKTAISKRSSCG
ncbi:MAG: hypothetical protein R2873_33375 [Caldilineaceae bacterium]